MIPSGHLCPNWETFTLMTPSAQLTEPTGEWDSDCLGTVIMEINSQDISNSVYKDFKGCNLRDIAFYFMNCAETF